MYTVLVFASAQRILKYMYTVLVFKYKYSENTQLHGKSCAQRASTEETYITEETHITTHVHPHTQYTKYKF